MTSTMSHDLAAAIAAFASTPRVLVATDFDGVLAPLVLNPMDSRPIEGGIPALTALAELPEVTVALVSGRALEPLRQLSGAQDPLVLIGSHGAEDSRHPDGLALDADQHSLLQTLASELDDLAARHPGVRVEVKPAGRVVHTRGLPPAENQAALAEASALAQRHPQLVVTPGKEVLELAVAHVGKGAALVALADEVGAGAVFYAGDDLTDEHGFAALAEDPNSDRARLRLTIRVGDGETLAEFRVDDETQIVTVFESLLEHRRAQSVIPDRSTAAG